MLENNRSPTMRLSIAAALASLIVSTSPSWAADVNVVHGIDGRDLGLPRELSVDIAVNGTCALKGVTYTTSAVVELSPATYRVTVHPSNGACSNSAVIDQSVTIPSDGSRKFSLVAHLSASGVPKLSAFNLSRDLAIPPVVSVRHLAFAAPVTVAVSEPKILGALTKSIRNGKFLNLGSFTDRFSYRLSVSAGRTRAVLARIRGVESKSFRIYNIFGSAKNGFAIVQERIAP